jgi:hypothetical protein
MARDGEGAIGKNGVDLEDFGDNYGGTNSQRIPWMHQAT